MLSGSDQNFVTGFSSQCFPVRSLANYRKIDEGGAWLVAYKAEQRQRFKAVLSNEPIVPKPAKENLHEKRQTPESTQSKSKKLDGFYLMKKFFVEDPSDLCSVNISGKGLYNVSEDDFLLFDNVVHVDAGDNNLPFNAFRNFMSLRELEFPLNHVSGGVNVGPHDFLLLEKLDLSYNRLTSDDILALGVIPCLKTLHLSGNELRSLPMEMARTYRAITGVTMSGTVESEDRKIRFGQLENLFLDNNELTDISTFSSLAGLRKLKYLNLENNEITSIPHLRLLGGRVRPKEDELAAKHSSVQFTSTELPSDENGTEEEEKGMNQDDKEGLIMDEVDELLGMKLPGDENGDVNGESEIIKLRHRASTITEDTSLLDDKFKPPKPFPSLLHLNLSNNMIYEEEGLLAVMGWPKLKELVIWGNPLTTAFKGDPPILSFQLGKVKGMRIFRQKPSKRPKPRVNLSTFAGYRKINDALPPVPRKRDILMLESPSKPLPISYVGPHSRPLPPISAPSGEFRTTTDNVVSPRQLNTAPTKKHGYSKNKRSRSVPVPQPSQEPRSEAEEAEEGERVKTTAEMTSDVDTTTPRQHQQAANTDEGFFLTQVDEPAEGETTDRVPKSKRYSRKSKHQHPDRPFSVETKYKGYEDLLDVDENDPDIVIPKDILGSVRSLQYILQHPLVFTDTKGVYKETPKTKEKSKEKTSRQNKVEAMGELLDKMRVENKIIESNLENVLQNFHKDKNLRKQFPEAKKLLDEVQAKYNEVRMKSLRANATQTQDILNSAISRDSSTSIDSSILEDDKHILEELAKFKKRLDGRL